MPIIFDYNFVIRILYTIVSYFQCKESQIKSLDQYFYLIIFKGLFHLSMFKYNVTYKFILWRNNSKHCCYFNVIYLMVKQIEIVKGSLSQKQSCNIHASNARYFYCYLNMQILFSKQLKKKFFSFYKYHLMFEGSDFIFFLYIKYAFIKITYYVIKVVSVCNSSQFL